MKKRVFLTRRLHDSALKELKKRYHTEVHSGRIPIPRACLHSGIREADGLVCFPYDRIGREAMDAAENLRVISTYSVGFDHIDIEYAKKKRIRVGYTPDVLTDATADLAFSLLLDITRRVSEGDRIIRGGKWRTVLGPYEYAGMDLQGKTLGILGLGRIGRTLAKRAQAFEMNITYHSRNRVPGAEKSLGIRYVPFDKLITQSDIISIHVPHTEETEYMFDMKTFRKMKKSAFVINTARGRIVNEGDLVTALKKKVIAGAGLDVFETEPIDGRHPLTRLQNVVLAPHIGSSTAGTRLRMAEIAVKNLNLGMAGKSPAYSVGY